MALHLVNSTDLDFSNNATQVCTLFNKGSNLALEVPGANMGDNIPVALARINNQTQQTWIFFRGIKGHCIMNYGTGTYLCGSQDRPGVVLASSKSPQEWDLVQSGDGYELKSTTGESLDINQSTSTVSLQSSGGAATVWSMAAVTSFPDPDPSQSFSTSPERTNIMNHVKNALHALVTIVQVLEHPENDTGLEVVDLVYTENDVATLGARIRECAKNFFFSNDTATRWSTSVENRLQTIISDKKKAEDKMHDLEIQRAASETRLGYLQGKVREWEGIVNSSQSAVNQSQSEYDKARNEYEQAKARERRQEEADNTCMGRIAKGQRSKHFPDPVPMRLATDTERTKKLRDEKKTKLDGDVGALNTFQTQLESEKRSLEALQQQLASAQQESSALSAQVTPMQQQLDMLSTLSGKINDCAHNMDYVLTRATALVIAETVSDLKVNIQEAVDHLGADKDITDALAFLDADRLRKLGDRARAIGRQVLSGKIKSKL